MRKLSLDLDQLAVESFETDRAGRGAGTVDAFSGIVDEEVPSDDGKLRSIDPARWTCRETCGTCDMSICQSCYFNTCYAGCQD